MPGQPGASAPSVSFVNARFSVLRAGTHISAHCGISNAKLRVHLGLSVPATPPPRRSAIRVGQEVRRWAEGKLLVFDDSFEHEVWWHWDDAAGSGGKGGNGESGADRATQRIVLILDVWHPRLSEQRIAELRGSFARNFAHTAAEGRLP